MYPIIIRQSHKANPCIHCKNPTHSINQHDRHICKDCLNGNASKISQRYADVTDNYNYLDKLCKQNSLILQIHLRGYFAMYDLVIKPLQLPLPDKNNIPMQLTLSGTALFLDKAQLDDIVSKLVGIANIVSNSKGE